MAAVTDDRKRPRADGEPHAAKRLRGASSLPTPSPTTPSRKGHGAVPRVAGHSDTPATPTPSTPTKLAAAAKSAYEARFPTAKVLPDVPLLYDTALKAHAAAAEHYQQAFVPLYIDIPDGERRAESPGKEEEHHIQPVPLYRNSKEEKYAHDPAAGHTALRLLILALDLLAIGLSHRGLSDRERAVLGLEFATVGLKLANAAAVMGQMKSPQRRALGVEINVDKLHEDLGTVVTKSLNVARRGRLLKVYVQGLELATFQLAVLRGKGSQALKILKQALVATPATDYKHRYSLRLHLMGYLRDTGSHEFFKAALELQKEAREAQHEAVVVLVIIARLRGHFDLRKWDSLGDTLEELRVAVGIALPKDRPPTLGEDPVKDVGMIHYYQFMGLHHGRIGDRSKARSALERVYHMMDQAVAQGIFSKLRCNGGVLKIRLASPTQPTQYMLVQTTPVNIMYTLTYLNAMVSRRNFHNYHSQNKTCRTLVHVNAMRLYESVAKIDDMWDTGFSPSQGIAHALQFRQTIMTVRVEALMEEALALFCRARFEDADKLLTEIVHTLRTLNLFHTHMPQITLLHAQFAQYMGRPEVAQRYYSAAKRSLVPGSELQVLVEIGLLGAQGKLHKLQENYENAEAVNELADICRSGSNAQLHAMGNFLSSLTDSEGFQAKRKLFAAYETARLGDLSMMYTLIFAFTTGVHAYGDLEKRRKQLETGSLVSGYLGGADREDGVGQATVGLWYARKLEEYYRLQGNSEMQTQAGKSVENHVARVKEIYEYSLNRFPLEAEGKDREEDEGTKGKKDEKGKKATESS